MLKVQDAMVAVVLFVSAYALTWTGQLAYARLMRFITETLETIPEFAHLSYMQALQLLLRAAFVLFTTVAPFSLIIAVTVFVVQYAQVGWLISFQPLQPKYEKIDPIKGFQNKLNPFKMKQAFMLAKTFAVMLVIAYLCFTVLRDNMGAILQSLTLSPAAALALISHLMIELAKKVALAMLGIAFISYMFERWNWWKGMKMSDKEMKDEYKKLEGDPHTKGKQKQKMQEIAMGAVQEAVPNADVVITNPTHYAVALEYKPHRGMKSPVVIAKGKNHMALFIRQLAEENFIPTVEDPPTARALYAQVKIGQTIPPELFVAVAKIIAGIMRKRRRPTTVQAPMPSLTGYAPVIIEPAPGAMPEPQEADPAEAASAREDPPTDGGDPRS